MKELNTTQKRYLMKILQTGEFEQRELMQVLEIKNIMADHRIIFENYKNIAVPPKEDRRLKE